MEAEEDIGDEDEDEGLARVRHVARDAVERADLGMVKGGGGAGAMGGSIEEVHKQTITSMVIVPRSAASGGRWAISPNSAASLHEQMLCIPLKP